MNRHTIIIGALSVATLASLWYAYNLKNRLANQKDSLDVLKQEAAARGVDVAGLGFV